jgi:ABC-type antimicrobial peptide transport system permease subunit
MFRYLPLAIITPSRHMEIPMLAMVRMVRRLLRQEFLRTAIGYLISTLRMRDVAKSPFGSYMPSLHPFEMPVAMACIFTAAAIGVMSSLLPAMNSSQISIVEALRSTD